MNKSLPPLAKIDSGSNCHGWTIYMLDTPPGGLRPLFWSIERIALKYLRRLSKNLRAIVEIGLMQF